MFVIAATLPAFRIGRGLVGGLTSYQVKSAERTSILQEPGPGEDLTWI